MPSSDRYHPASDVLGWITPSALQMFQSPYFCSRYHNQRVPRFLGKRLAVLTSIFSVSSVTIGIRRLLNQHSEFAVGMLAIY